MTSVLIIRTNFQDRGAPAITTYAVRPVMNGVEQASAASAGGSTSSGGDNAQARYTGNRVDRFLAATAYVDGSRPSIIMARGYYTRAVIATWDFRGGQLTRRWTYDSGRGGAYGQGNHNLSVAGEEVIWRSTDNRALRIYSTTDPTSISRPSLMQDRQYRLAVAWQNTAYNQPPHASFATP